MITTQLLLAFVWVMLMLVYLLGDVLRIFSGDFKPGEIEGKKVSPAVWLGISVFMLIPILMIFVTLTFDQPLNRIINIAVAGIFFLFNIFGLPTYPSAYDRFLIIVGLVFNILTIWYAWNWVS